MTPNDMQENDVKVYKATRELQMKAGTGHVDEKTIIAAEKVIQESNIDFASMAREHLFELKKSLKAATEKGVDLEKARPALTKPIMALKSESSMFGYDLVGQLANIMLSFLESVDTFDKTVVDILNAHHTTLNAVITKNMRGDGGEMGDTLKLELKNVIRRYMIKRGA